jgi:hypothetical protein
MTKRDTLPTRVLHPDLASGTLKFWSQTAPVLCRLAKTNN